MSEVLNLIFFFLLYICYDKYVIEKIKNKKLQNIISDKTQQNNLLAKEFGFNVELNKQLRKIIVKLESELEKFKQQQK